MSKKVSSKKKISSSASREQRYNYETFATIDGQHPWHNQVPEGGQLYQVRKLNKGKVIYFNFELAREMGLIAPDHSNALNKRLEKKILDTFSIRIINEYDIENQIKYRSSDIKKNKFMATRYLQMQHKNKQGKTSGDGRSIWNGVIQKGHKVWDISSRGTGVTKLAPGVVEAGHSLQSGSTEFGYGCGLAEIDELLSTSILAEVFHSRNIRTERMLAVIDFGDGTGIGVRAGENLIRPAHLFRYLKMGDLDALKRSSDYLIQRQCKNKEWPFKQKDAKKYEQMLTHICKDFAKFAAQLDREYIFSWLDWDGDNVLANAGIIDYGSVRLMGLRHDNYRFDDVERFSTNLNEQRSKARLTVQVFAQATDYIQTGKKRPLIEFKNHHSVKLFDKIFHETELHIFLKQVGCSEKQVRYLLSHKKTLVERFFQTFSRLEKVKTHKKTTKVTDGINRPAIFNMKQFLREFPLLLLQEDKKFPQSNLSAQAIFKLVLSSYASRKDQVLKPNDRKKFTLLQKQYKALVKAISVENNHHLTLKYLSKNAHQESPATPLTGNGLVFVVNEILEFRKKGLHDQSLQTIIEQLISKYVPTVSHSAMPSDPTVYKLWENMLSIIDGHKEDI